MLHLRPGLISMQVLCDTGHAIVSDCGERLRIEASVLHWLLVHALQLKTSCAWCVVSGPLYSTQVCEDSDAEGYTHGLAASPGRGFKGVHNHYIIYEYVLFGRQPRLEARLLQPLRATKALPVMTRLKRMKATRRKHRQQQLTKRPLVRTMKAT